MTDDSLLELERAVRAGGDASARVRYATALQRLGRRDEALIVLRPIHREEIARGLLRSYPAWSDRDADPGRTRAIDVEPIRTTPRVRWKTRVSLGPEESLDGTLLASPLGVVTRVYSPGRWRLVALDPESGAVTWTHECGTKDVVFRGDVVIAVGEPTRARDLVTGEELWSGCEADADNAWVFGNGLVVQTEIEEWRLVARAFAQPDPRRAPEAGPLWTRDLEGARGEFVEPAESVRPDGIVVETRRGRVLLSATTGEEQSSDAGLPRDERGFIRFDGGGDTAMLVTSTGEVAWSHGELRPPISLGPSRVFFTDNVLLQCVVFDRATGEAVDVFRVDQLEHSGLSAALARDVLVWAVNDVVHARANGRELWSWSIGEGITIRVIAPQQRRIYAVAAPDTVLCFEEPS